MKTKTKLKKNWIHTGGGCGLGKGRYTCDESYENKRLKKRVTIYTTFERHWMMPGRVLSLSSVRRLKGWVKL